LTTRIDERITMAEQAKALSASTGAVPVFAESGVTGWLVDRWGATVLNHATFQLGNHGWSHHTRAVSHPSWVSGA
jgi:hypothetical protein